MAFPNQSAGTSGLPLESAAAAAASDERCRDFVDRYLVDLPQLKIAEVGGDPVSDTYRALLAQPGWDYTELRLEPEACSATGADLATVPNANVRSPSAESWGGDPRLLAQYDVVISGQVWRSVARPWKWIHQLAALGREGSLIWVCAPNTGGFESHSGDCWRVCPAGMRVLFEDAGIEMLECRVWGADTVGIGRRRVVQCQPQPTADAGTVSHAATAVRPLRATRLMAHGNPRSIEGALWTGYLQACQQPSDINQHLPYLMRLAHCCDDVVVVGFRDARSTMALLMGQPGRLRVVDAVRRPAVSELEVLRGDCDFEFEQCHSLRVELGLTDLLLVDTFHTFGQLSAELGRHARSVSRWIVLYGTTTFGSVGEDGGPGVWLAVEEFLKSYPEWFVAARYHHNNGLTILQRREFRVGLSLMLTLFGGPCELISLGSHRQTVFLDYGTGLVLEDVAVSDHRVGIPAPDLFPAAGNTYWRLEGSKLVISARGAGDTLAFNTDDDACELYGETLQNERFPVILKHVEQHGAAFLKRSPNSGIAIVIGSYSRPPWVRANVAAIRNLLGSEVPVLICDDRSPPAEFEMLRRVADEHHCELQVNPVHLGHYGGDINAVRVGIAWARQNGCSHVFKLSQRTIPVRPGWAWELSRQMTGDGSAVAYQTQRGTREIRTELLGFNVEDWCSEAVTRIVSEPVVGLFETWFYDVCWKLFPWRHTPIPWLSRSRHAENSNVISYYAMGFERVASLYRDLTGTEIESS